MEHDMNMPRMRSVHVHMHVHVHVIPELIIEEWI